MPHNFIEPPQRHQISPLKSNNTACSPRPGFCCRSRLCSRVSAESKRPLCSASPSFTNRLRTGRGSFASHTPCKGCGLRRIPELIIVVHVIVSRSTNSNNSDRGTRKMNPYSHPVSVLPNLPPSELTKVGHQLHVCIREIYKNRMFSEYFVLTIWCPIQRVYGYSFWLESCTPFIGGLIISGRMRSSPRFLLATVC